MPFSDDFTDEESSSEYESDESEPNTEDMEFIDDESDSSESVGSESDVEITPEEMVVGQDEINLVFENVGVDPRAAGSLEGLDEVEAAGEEAAQQDEAMEDASEDEGDYSESEEYSGEDTSSEEETSEESEEETSEESGDDGEESDETTGERGDPCPDFQVLPGPQEPPVVIKIEDDGETSPPKPKKARMTLRSSEKKDPAFQAALRTLIRRAV